MTLDENRAAGEKEMSVYMQEGVSMYGKIVESLGENEHLIWRARQVVRNVDHELHLFIRLKLTGTHFPQKLTEPFVSVGGVRSRFVLISEDGLSLYAYFDQPLPEKEPVMFGYGDEVSFQLPRRFYNNSVDFLNLSFIPRGTRNVEKFTAFQ